MAGKKEPLAKQSVFQAAPIVAREDDGTLQITLTIQARDVQAAEQTALEELVKTMQIPGFRAGKAPLEEVKRRASSQEVLEKILSIIIPSAYRKAVEKNALRPVLTPRFELIHAESGKDWQVRAFTSEAPKVDLGNYKEEIEGAKRTQSLWVPGKDSQNEKKEPTREEKEQFALEIILKTTKVTVSKLLIEEEVNHRLSSLLDQIQKLGLTIDEYLARTERTVETLRKEYAEQASEQFKTMVVLSHIAQREGITVSDQEIQDVIKNTHGQEQEISSDQKELVHGLLLRRRALDNLVSLM